MVRLEITRESIQKKIFSTKLKIRQNNLRVDGNHGLPGRVTKYADRVCSKLDQLLTHGVGGLIEMLR